MHRANTAREYDELFDSLVAPIRWLELTDEIAGRAVDVQRELARTSHGNHVRPAVDFLVERSPRPPAISSCGFSTETSA
ncbi:MAG TPA: hypothetical protein VGQ84_05510 [Gaiellaceae bacterium]|nr:hypothetical protein [Gaiellaceae bacterium]